MLITTHSQPLDPKYFGTEGVKSSTGMWRENRWGEDPNLKQRVVKIYSHLLKKFY